MKPILHSIANKNTHKKKPHKTSLGKEKFFLLFWLIIHSSYFKYFYSILFYSGQKNQYCSNILASDKDLFKVFPNKTFLEI